MLGSVCVCVWAPVFALGFSSFLFLDLVANCDLDTHKRKHQLCLYVRLSVLLSLSFFLAVHVKKTARESGAFEPYGDYWRL